MTPSISRLITAKSQSRLLIEGDAGCALVLVEVNRFRFVESGVSEQRVERVPRPIGIVAMRARLWTTQSRSCSLMPGGTDRIASSRELRHVAPRGIPVWPR